MCHALEINYTNNLIVLKGYISSRLTPLFVFRASSKNYHERSAKTLQHPPLVGDWMVTVYFGFEWLVVPFVFVYDLGAQRRVILTTCLLGGQLADREERSDECDHLCFGLASLIQPLITPR